MSPRNNAPEIRNGYTYSTGYIRVTVMVIATLVSVPPAILSSIFFIKLSK